MEQAVPRVVLVGSEADELVVVGVSVSVDVDDLRM
jgi:hypothetical protein